MTTTRFGKDGRGNQYVQIGDWTRITYVKAASREETKNWAGSDVIRIQSRLNQETEKLMPGAEYPIATAEDALALLTGIARLCQEGRDPS